jgi:4-hydroxy-3-methylbut-2-enyl diphosphate reductase IspH
MAEQQDRSICVTFSLKLSALSKLERLIAVSGRNRSELLASWIDASLVGIDLGASEPAELVKEPT